MRPGKKIRIRKTLNDTPSFLAVVGSSVVAGVVTTLVVQHFFTKQYRYVGQD